MPRKLSMALAVAAFLAATTPHAAGIEPVAGSPFLGGMTVDTLGRDITWYISGAPDRRPLALFVQGSGCTAQLRRRADGGVRGGYHDVLLAQSGGRFHVLTVEKPGVMPGAEGNGGSATGCPPEFLREHTLERWVVALSAALDAARRLAQNDPTRLLVFGHSEGGIVAARLARLEPGITHVA
ncbi:MAG: hypothetical protein HY246_03475, partial [Proteobacteria bacterium]|nr:hypothetical protein [Pseudomonadota bacterium]